LSIPLMLTHHSGHVDPPLLKRSIIVRTLRVKDMV
jgi:hypothetical protein